MSELTVRNRVALHQDGYIEVTLVGDQNYETIERSAEECEQLAEVLKYDKRPVLGLIDFTLEKGFSTEANKATLESMSRINYDRIALFGSSKVLTEVSSLIIKAIGKDDSTRVFKTREEAVAWLVMKDPLAG